MVNIKGITNKLTQNADKLGQLIGVTTGSQNGFQDIISSVENAISGNVHAPDINQFLENLKTEPYVRSGVMMWLIGTVLGEVGISEINKFAKPIAKFGMGYAVGAAANKLLWLSTHADEGSADFLKYSKPTQQIASNYSY